MPGRHSLFLAKTLPSFGRARRKASESLNRLPAGIVIRGDVDAGASLTIDGAVIGTVRGGRIVVGPLGRVTGELHGEGVEVAGTVTGTIVAKRLHLSESGEVEGDTFQEVLSMASGARFSDRSHTVQPLQPAASPPFLAVVA